MIMQIKALTAAASVAILGLFASAGKAAGVLIFGRVTKGGIGVGGEFGEGVLRVQGRTVNYYSVASASVGLTLGVAKHREIILFMTQGALDRFTKS
jgi:lipid-binding SYLF domain-containing protein